MFLRFLILSICIVVLNGCITKELSISNDARTHMIESEKLSLLIRELDMVVYERVKSELDKDNIRRRYALQLSDILKNLSENIENLPNKRLSAKVTKKDLEIYKQYADALYVNGHDIYELAQKYEFEKLSAKLDQVQANCKACHQYFRAK